MTDRAGTGAFADIDSMLADLLCLPTVEHTERESRRGKLSRRVVAGAAEFIERTGVLAQVELWDAEDNPDRATNGGRPTVYDDRFRIVLTILFALLFAGEDPLISRISETVTSRLHTASRTLLGLPTVEKGSDTAVYHRVYRALRAFVVLIDSAPGTTGRRLTRARVEEIKAARDPDECARKHARLVWLANEFLEATARAVPDEALAEWEGNVAFDATLTRIWGKKGSPTLPKKMTPTTRDISLDRMSPEFQAGWYHRDEEDHADTSTKNGRRSATSEWGYEAHLATMVANKPGEAPAFPLLTLAISIDKPAGRVAENALDAMLSLTGRGYPTGWFISDRAYFPNPKAEKLQLPLRALGYQLVGDYRDDQLGIQAEYAGAILVEGSWYCPSMPQSLIDATKDHRADRIDDATYYLRIQQRAQYAFRPKHKPGPDGNTAYMCPARGPGATADCQLATTTSGTAPTLLGMPTTRTRVLNPPAHPDTCCTNKNSVTIPVAPPTTGPRGGSTRRNDAAKYAHDVQFQSKEWRALYGLRNTVETFNAYTKSPTDENLEEPARRRVRGYAFQVLLLSAMVTASNLRKINSWIKKRNEPAQEPTKPLHATRKNASPSLQSHRPPANSPPYAIPA
ncbi:hypothetical protein [Nocardioides allogilvus]|uniref:hypothetical protein n=1 Tax=Nocardioides allogilvus TaxID=2072017 RepID=UPI000D2F4C56|nr:hypothetical protein [Nocardioides allogilvus]